MFLQFFLASSRTTVYTYATVINNTTYNQGAGESRRHGGAFRGRAPRMTACAPPSVDCAPKKLIGSGPPECKSRPETRKIVFIASEFVENRTISGIKTRICEIFELNTFSFGLHLRIRGKSNDFWDNNQNL